MPPARTGIPARASSAGRGVSSGYGPATSSGFEELDEAIVDVVRHLLSDVVAARHGIGVDDVGGVSLPDLGELLGPFRRLAAGAPQDQGRHLDLLVLVGCVDLKVSGRPGAEVTPRAPNCFFCVSP